MKKRKVSLIHLAVLIFLCAISTHAGAQPFVLSKVADLNTPIPEGSGNFTSVHEPAISGNNVAFLGSGSGQLFIGIYLFNGTTLSKVADRNTPIPGGSGNFIRFGPPEISGVNVVFWAEGSGQDGIYLFNGATLSKVADHNTPIPEGSGNFTGFFYAWISGNNVTFWGEGSSGQAGSYLYNGTTLIKVVDLNTPIPGGSGNFTGFDIPLVSDTNVAFWGSGPSGETGIYLFNGTTLSKVADLNTPIPGGSGNFTSFDYAKISGGNVVFGGAGSSGQIGFYLFNGTTLDKVVDSNTPVPGGSGNFTGFQSHEISGSNVAFMGRGSGQEGIYLFNSSNLTIVADQNTMIPGGSGNFTSVGTPAISGGNVAFGGGGLSVKMGLYLFNGTTLSKLADSNTPIPWGSENFFIFHIPLISGSNVAFMGANSSWQYGIYLASPQPAPFAVPTLTEWGMIIISVLLGGSGIYLIRRRSAV